MTGRPKGIWHSACKHCSAPISNEGSGRPRTRCNNCRLRLMREYSSKHYKSVKIARPTQAEWNVDYVRAIKISIGECYDKLYCRPDLQCTTALLSTFAFDHRDPLLKLFPLSQPFGKMTAGPRRGERITASDIDAEIAKCDLVCHNCHSVRTWTGKHHSKRGNTILITVLHPTLFEVA